MYKCTLCGLILKPHECRISHSSELCEIYVNCPQCGGECEDYGEGEEDKPEFLIKRAKAEKAD